jgi:hypothetical protein
MNLYNFHCHCRFHTLKFDITSFYKIISISSVTETKRQKFLMPRFVLPVRKHDAWNRMWQAEGFSGLLNRLYSWLGNSNQSRYKNFHNNISVSCYLVHTFPTLLTVINLSVYTKFPCAWSCTKMPLFTTLNVTVDLQKKVWDVQGILIFRLADFHIADTPVSSRKHFEFRRIIIKWKQLNIKEFFLWIQEFKRLDLHQIVQPYFLFFWK